MAIIKGSGLASIRLSAKGAGRLAARHYFSGKYFRAALRFADQAAEIEARYSRGELSYADAHDEHEMSVISAITMGVASFEARINEVINDAEDGQAVGVRGLSPEDVQKLKGKNLDKSRRKEWPDSMAKCGGIIALLSGAAGWDSVVWRHLASVIRLRNRLIHPEPEYHWYLDPGELPAQGSLEAKIGTCFEHSALASPNVPFFPERCLGAGCAKWVLESIYRFLVDFEDETGISHNFPKP